MKLTPLRITIMACGLGFLVANNLVLYFTFLSAFFSPDQAVRVTVNSMGEAWLEFFVLPFCLLVSLWALIEVLRISPLKISRRGVSV